MPLLLQPVRSALINTRYAESVAAGGTWSGANVRVDSARNASYFNVKAAELESIRYIIRWWTNVCVSIDSVTLTVVNSATACVCRQRLLLRPGTRRWMHPITRIISVTASPITNLTRPHTIPPRLPCTVISTVNANGCIDTVWRAMAVLKPELIDPLRLVCKRGDEAVLSVDTQMASVTWFDNTVTYTKTVYDTGSYTVELRNTTGCIKWIPSW